MTSERDETIAAPGRATTQQPTAAQPMTVTSAALLTFVSQVLQLVGATATAVVVARLLGPAGKGVVSLVTLSGTLLITFSGFGVPVYHGCVAGRGEYSLAALRGNAILTAAIGSLLVTLAGLPLWLLGALPASAAQVAWIAAVLPAGLLMRNVAGIFQGQGRFREYNALTAVTSTLTPVCTAAFAYAFGGVHAALAAWWLGYVAAAALGWWLSRGGTAAPSAALLRAALEFGVAVWSVQLVGEANWRFDTYLAAAVGGAEGAGYYSVAVSISFLLSYLPAAIGTGALPRLATASGEEAARLAGMGCRISLWSSAALAVVIALVARPLIRLLFGPAFEPAVVPLRWLLPGIVAYSMGHVTTSYFYGQLARPMLNGLVALISLLVGLAATAVLAPQYGLAGVAMAATIGRCVAQAVNLWLFTRLSHCPPAEALLPRPGDLALLLAPLRRWWPPLRPVRPA